MQTQKRTPIMSGSAHPIPGQGGMSDDPIGNFDRASQVGIAAPRGGARGHIAYDVVMATNGRHVVMFSITAHEDTCATEVDERALDEWDRRFTASSCTGRVQLPRPVAAEPDPSRLRHIVHHYEGVMWE